MLPTQPDKQTNQCRMNDTDVALTFSFTTPERRASISLSWFSLASHWWIETPGTAGGRGEGDDASLRQLNRKARYIEQVSTKRSGNQPKPQDTWQHQHLRQKPNRERKYWTLTRTMEKNYHTAVRTNPTVTTACAITNRHIKTSHGSYQLD